MRIETYTVVAEPQPEGGWTAAATKVPGVITEGDTWEELELMARDAIALMLDVDIGAVHVDLVEGRLIDATRSWTENQQAS